MKKAGPKFIMVQPIWFKLKPRDPYCSYFINIINNLLKLFINNLLQMYYNLLKSISKVLYIYFFAMSQALFPVYKRFLSSIFTEQIS